MKRILMISTHGYFEAKPVLGKVDTGGQIVFVIELSKQLANFGYLVDILTRKFENLSQIEKINDRVRIIRIPCGGKKFIPKEYITDNLAELVDGFKKYCVKNRLKYEFINSHYWDAGFVGMLLKESFNIPHIYTPHSLGVWKKMNMEEKMTKEEIEKAKEDFEQKYNFTQRIGTETTTMFHAEKVIATTIKQEEIISKYYRIPKKKIALITPGFDQNRYRKIPKSEVEKELRKENLPDKFILTVGRMAWNKGYDLLIKSLEHVFKKLPDHKFVLAAGSKNPTKSELSLRNHLKRLASSRGISKNIIYYNYLDNLPYFYNKANLFVMPSRYEPFGITAIEAMACGTATIITSFGGLKDFMINNYHCTIVNPFDEKGMAGAIIGLLENDKLRKEIATRGYKKAVKNFTWEKVAKRILKVLEKI